MVPSHYLNQWWFVITLGRMIFNRNSATNQVSRKCFLSFEWLTSCCSRNIWVNIWSSHAWLDPEPYMSYTQTMHVILISNQGLPHCVQSCETLKDSDHQPTSQLHQISFILTGHCRFYKWLVYSLCFVETFALLLQMIILFNMKLHSS